MEDTTPEISPFSPRPGINVYTIGHSNRPVDEFIDLLNAHRIQVVVDVRSMPYSQYTAQFNREQLTQSLRAQGIDYAFAGEYLGGRPKDPACYKNGQLPDGKANYLKLVNYPKVAQQPWYQKGIGRLLELAAERRTAIMCSEEDPSHCHRHHLIATTLLEHGVGVRHLRGDGTLEDAAVPAVRPQDTPEHQQLSLFDLEAP